MNYKLKFILYHSIGIKSVVDQQTFMVDMITSDRINIMQSLIKRLFGEKEHPLICWGDGSPIRDFIYAGDVADGIIKNTNKN